MFNSELRQAMREETVAYFDYVVRENRDVLELVDSNYTFVNETLAKHYGIDGVTGNATAPRRVAGGQSAGRRADAGDVVGGDVESESHVAGEARAVYFGQHIGFAAAAAAAAECADCWKWRETAISGSSADDSRVAGTASARAVVPSRAMPEWTRWGWRSRTSTPWECGATRSRDQPIDASGDAADGREISTEFANSRRLSRSSTGSIFTAV